MGGGDQLCVYFSSTIITSDTQKEKGINLTVIILKTKKCLANTFYNKYKVVSLSSSQKTKIKYNSKRVCRRFQDS